MEKVDSGPSIFDVHKPFIKVKDASGEETVHYSLFYEGIPEDFRLVAEQELNETEENRRECLGRLKEAMQGEFVEDALLLAFLRNKKFNVNKAEAKLRKFVAKRRDLGKKLAEMDMQKITEIIDNMGFGMLPYRDKHGRLVLYTRSDGMHLDKYTMNDLGLIIISLGILTMKYPLTTITGFVYFGECKGERSTLYLFYEFFKSLKFYSPTILSLPIRVPAVEVLNPISVARWIARFVHPLFSGKIIGRITFHNPGYEDLHEHFSPAILPDIFGGRMGPLNNDVYRKKLLDFIKDIRKEYS